MFSKFIESVLPSALSFHQILLVTSMCVLLSHVRGDSQTTSMTVEVINDSNSYVTFKKWKSVGHAEPADALPKEAHSLNVFKTGIEQQESGDSDASGFNC